MNITIGAGVEAQLVRVSEEIREFELRGRISPEDVIALLVEHWQTVPPSRQWKRDHVNVYLGNNGPKWGGRR